MRVVEFLQHNTIEDLQARYGIKAKRHADYPNLVHLKYSQLKSPMAEPIVQECRGLIVDEAADWRVVSRPYDKFFNYNEGHARQIDWQSARVYEKLDGSLMVLYQYQGLWHVSTSGTPDASGNVGDTSLAFGDLFWQIWYELGYSYPVHTHLCYMFELMTPHNRVIVRHDKNRLVLHGVRDVRTYQEHHPESHARMNGWECVRGHNLNNLEAILDSCRMMDPVNGEGFVICDAIFNRVKVKSPQYVALSHIKESFSIRRLLDVIRNNEGDEFLSYFPEWSVLYHDAKDKYLALRSEASAFYESIKQIETQKDFALEATKKGYSSILFSLRKGNIQSVEEGLRDMQVERLESLLGLSRQVL